MHSRFEQMAQRHDRMRLFIKIWFAFIALLGIAAIVCVIWLFVLLAQAGPDGIGEGIGRFIGSIERGMDQ